MTRKALARRIAEVLFNEPATRRGAGAAPTRRAARILAGCFVARRSKTTAGILPPRAAQIRAICAQVIQAFNIRSPAKIRSSAAIRASDLAHLSAVEFEFSHLTNRQSKSRLMRILTPFFSVLFFASVAIAQGAPILSFNMTKADGSQVVYEFRTPDNVVFSSFADTAEAQHQAGVAALTWAQSFYGAHDVFLQSVDFKALPVPHYVASFNGQIGTIRQSFFAVILGSGTPLEPAEVRVLTQKATGASYQGTPKPVHHRDTKRQAARRNEAPVRDHGTKDSRAEAMTPAAGPRPNVWISPPAPN
jgi:hypothetical protein